MHFNKCTNFIRRGPLVSPDPQSGPLQRNVKKSCNRVCVECYIYMYIYVCVCMCVYMYIFAYTGYTQKNGAVSKVNKKFISHPTRAQHTPSAVATVQVSHALPAVRFSCLLRGHFPRWHHSRKTLSVCSVLRCPNL